MRCTQYIGLTDRAKEYVKDLKEMESDESTHGMFPDVEVIKLRRWDVPEKFKGDIWPDRCIREVVQAVPWSSGPMIFTCLEVDLANCLNDPKAARIKILEWIHDPSVEGSEFDAETGRFWV